MLPGSFLMVSEPAMKCQTLPRLRDEAARAVAAVGSLFHAYRADYSGVNGVLHIWQYYLSVELSIPISSPTLCVYR